MPNIAVSRRDSKKTLHRPLTTHMHAARLTSVRTHCTLLEREGPSHTPTQTDGTPPPTAGGARTFIRWLKLAQLHWRAGSIRCPSPERFTRDGIIAESCGPTTPQQPWLRRRHRARQERAARVAVGKGAWTRVLAPTIGEDPGSTRLSRLPAASHCYLE